MDANSKLEAAVEELGQTQGGVSAVSEKEFKSQIKTLTDQNLVQVGINKNLASKVLNLEKELQTEKKRRLEAEKKLLDASAAG